MTKAAAKVSSKNGKIRLTKSPWLNHSWHVALCGARQACFRFTHDHEVTSSDVIDENGVFVNVPFDSSYEPLFITLVGVLVFLGQDPHCVLEVREKGDGRLTRIVDLMRTCKVSIHDLSRTGTPARFNMPFELGLACALKIADPKAYEILVLESEPYRIDRTLSDYKGRDPLIHHGTCDGMLACLLDAFVPGIPGAAVEYVVITSADENILVTSADQSVLTALTQ